MSSNRKQHSMAAEGQGRSARGSLGSAASSSGCSSVECSSLEAAPTIITTTNSKNITGDTQPETNKQPEVAAISCGQDGCDFLELNEVLYLRGRQEDFKTMATTGEGPTIQPIKSDQNTMSEFSAFTLRKSIKNRGTLINRKREEQNGGTGKISSRPRVRRASSTAIGTKKSLINDNNNNNHQQQRIEFTGENCCGCCTTTSGRQILEYLSPAIEQQQQQHMIIDNDKRHLVPLEEPRNWRRATIVGRPPATLSHKSRRLPDSGMVCERRFGTVGPFSGVATVAAAMAAQRLPLAVVRRSLPVPPPVVPFYKETALLEMDRSFTGSGERLTGKLENSNSKGLERIHDEKAEEGGSHLVEVTTKPVVNILHDSSNNNNNEYSTSYTESQQQGDAEPPAGNRKWGTCDIDSSSLNTTKTMDEKDSSKFYCDVWDDLRRQMAGGGNGDKLDGTRSMATRVTSNEDKQANSTKGSGSNHENVEDPLLRGSSGSAEENRIGGSISAAFSRKTGKFLECLRFLTNFGSVTCSNYQVESSTTQVTSSYTSSISSTSDAQKVCNNSSSSAIEFAQVVNSDNYKPETLRPLPVLPPPQQTVYDEATGDSRIYDTPEFGGSPNDSEASEVPNISFARIASTAAAERPRMPPPPPPPPLPAKQMGAVRAPPPPPPPRSSGTCAMGLGKNSLRKSSNTMQRLAPAPSRKFNQTLGSECSKKEEVARITNYHSSSIIDQYSETDYNNNNNNNNHHSEVRDVEGLKNIIINELQANQEVRSQLNVSKPTQNSARKAVRWATIDYADSKPHNRKQQSDDELHNRKQNTCNDDNDDDDKSESAKRPERNIITIIKQKQKKLGTETTTNNTGDSIYTISNSHHYQELSGIRSVPRANETLIGYKRKDIVHETDNNERGNSRSSCKSCHITQYNNNHLVSDQEVKRKSKDKGENNKLGHTHSTGNSSRRSIEGSEDLLKSQPASAPTTSSSSSPTSLKLLQKSPSKLQPLAADRSSSTNMGASHSTTQTSLANHKATPSKAPNSTNSPPKQQIAAAAPKSPGGVDGPPGKQRTKSNHNQSTKISNTHQAEASSKIEQQANRQKRNSQQTVSINSRTATGNGNLQPDSSSSSSKCKSTLRHLKLATDSSLKLVDDSIERRRKSIQDGDVFIYPTLYKNLNECQRCSRDNKICSCNNNNNNNIESAAAAASDGAAKVDSTSSSSGANKCIKPAEAATFDCTTSRKCQRDIKVGSHSMGMDTNNNTNKNKINIQGQGELGAPDRKEEVQYKGSDICSMTGGGSDQIKTVYKISIATASIDKKSNQLRLSTPKVIGTSQPSDPIAVAYSLPQSSTRNSNQLKNECSIKRTLPANLSASSSGSRTTNRVNFLLEGENLNSNQFDINQKVPISSPMMAISTDRGGGAIASEKHKSTTTITTSACKATASITRTSIGNYNTGNKLTTSHDDKINDLIDTNNNNKDDFLFGSRKCDIKGELSCDANHAKIVRKLIEQRECNSEEQLTCNMSRDSIKITSTSIRIGDQNNNNNNSSISNICSSQNNLASIIPIQTLSTRRRNLAAKLSRQAIYEAQPNKPLTLTKQLGLEEEDEDRVLEEEEEEDSSVGVSGQQQAQEDSSSDALEYSPILTSVRDYIKNVNTAELQVQSPTLLTGATDCVELAPHHIGAHLINASGCPIMARDSIEFMATSSAHNQTEATISTSLANIMSTPKTIVTSTTGAITITNSGSNNNIVSTTTSSSSSSTASATSLNNKSLKANGLLIHQSGSELLHTDSPKKSIFEGASKDEILEYLEDARERVPEILMAADDVMVINENELIVVNQLEPDSPATPISIVEATDIIGTNAELVSVGDSESGQQLLVATPEPPALIERHSSPDQLRHRLQQIYQQQQQLQGSRLTGSGSQFSSDNNTMDEDTGIGSSQSGLSSKVDSNRNSMDTPITPTELKMAGVGSITSIGATGAISPNVKNFPSSLVRTTIESIEDETFGNDPTATTTLSNLEQQNPITTTTTCTTLFSLDQSGQIQVNPKEFMAPPGDEKLGQNDDDDLLNNVAEANATTQQHQQQQQQQPSGLMGGGFRMLNFGGANGIAIEARRRNSTSSEGSTHRALANQVSGNCTIQMLRMKQRYSNRDSLSSPSTSPPSSASPSSSTSSSNQTSGNCSAASTFYASSSLSCSSPLLALNTMATNSIPLALGGQLLSHLTGSQQQQQAQVSSGSRFSDQYHDLHMLDSLIIGNNNNTNNDQQQQLDIAPTMPECANDLNLNLNLSNLSQVERDDSGLGSDYIDQRGRILDPLAVVSVGTSLSDTKLLDREAFIEDQTREQQQQQQQQQHIQLDDIVLPVNHPSALAALIGSANDINGRGKVEQLTIIPMMSTEDLKIDKVKIITTTSSPSIAPIITTTTTPTMSAATFSQPVQVSYSSCNPATINQNQNKTTYTTSSSTSMVRFNSSANLMSRSVHGHYATMNRLNNYFMNRNPLSENSSSTSSDNHTIEFQCLDCDQFIDVDHATIMHKSNELRLLRESDRLDTIKGGGNFNEISMLNADEGGKQEKPMTTDQLDRAYIAAMNGLPLCNGCEKKRIERKEIISEFVETELKYGRDLKIIHDEFYRPMQIAGLLSKDQITGVFLNLEELIVAHCKFAIRLEAAIRDAHSMGDGDFNTVNIGRLFVESAEMLTTFESYCIRQGSAACLLARLAKEKELLRIFLRVSQMENTLLRRMNLAAFLMVPVQRVTKYPLLLNRLYKVTAYHHKDREVLRDAQLRVELHLEHINQQTKGIGATNKIWRRISNLSAPISNRRGLINAEDIGYIKLRKTAMDMLKWDRDETKFIHSGRLNFAPLNEFLIKQKMKPIRYMAAHALLIVLGKPNWKYRPDLVKSNLDNKLMTPTPGGNGVKEAALLLFREKGGRFIPCREPLFLSNCVLSADCSQYNSECPVTQPGHHHQNSSSSSSSSNGSNQKAANATATTTTNVNSATGSVCSAQTGKTSDCGGNSTNTSANTQINNNRIRLSSSSATSAESRDSTIHDRSASTDSQAQMAPPTDGNSTSIKTHSRETQPKIAGQPELRANSNHSDSISMASVKSLPDNAAHVSSGDGCSPPTHTSRSYSLASALPRTTVSATTSSAGSLTKSSSITSSNLTIITQLMTKVNSYGHKQQQQQQQLTSGSDGRSAGLKANCNGEQHKVAGPATTTTVAAITNPAESFIGISTNPTQQQQQQQQQQHLTAGGGFPQDPVTIITAINNNNNHVNRLTTTSNPTNSSNNCPNNNNNNSNIQNEMIHPQYYNHLLFNNHHHHQPYGDYEESFEIHERLSKESMLLRADTPLKTRYWLQMLRYHAKDLGQWRARRNGLANIMMMRQE